MVASRRTASDFAHVILQYVTPEDACHMIVRLQDISSNKSVKETLNLISMELNHVLAEKQRRGEAARPPRPDPSKPFRYK